MDMFYEARLLCCSWGLKAYSYKAMNNQEPSELSQTIKNSDIDKVSVSDLERYIFLLKPDIAHLLRQICSASSEPERTALLQSIFTRQWSLMDISIQRSEVQMPDELWEIAKDFDNDDPKLYPYLLKKVLNKEYLIQRDEK